MKYTVNQYDHSITILTSFTYTQFLEIFKKYGDDYTYKIKEQNITYTCNYN